MKTFKDIISEVAEPTARREKAFKDKHVIQKIDHPVADEGQFTAKKTKRDKTKKASMHNGEDEAVYEEKMSDAEMKKREDIVMGMKKSKADLKKRYGDRWKSVMYATATKNAMKEAVELDEASQKKLDKAMSIINARITKPGQPPKHPSYHSAPEDIKAAAKNLAKNMKESVELDEDISKMSHSRLKWHMNTGVPHGSYTKDEMKKERDRRLKYRDSADEYKKAKPMLEGTDLGEAKFDAYSALAKMAGTPKNPDKGSALAHLAKSKKVQDTFKKVKKEEVEQIDELSKKTLKSYSDKANKSLDRLAKQRDAVEKSMSKTTAAIGKRSAAEKAAHRATTQAQHNKATAAYRAADKSAKKNLAGHGDLVKQHSQLTKKINKRMDGMDRAYDKMHEEVEQLDELSPNTLHSYIKGASKDLAKRSRMSGYDDKRGNYADGDKNRKRANKRMAGIASASGRLADKANQNEEVELDEVLDTPKAMDSYKNKANRSLDRASNSAITKMLRSKDGPQAADISKETETMDKRKKGLKMADRNAARKTFKALRKEEYMDEAFKAGSMKLKDGSSVKVTSEQASSLNALFNELNSSNKKKMEERLMSSSKGFNEILSFAKEAL